MALFDCFKKKPEKITEILVPRSPEPQPQEKLDAECGEYRQVTAEDLKDYLKAYVRGNPGYGIDPKLPVKTSRLLAKYFDMVKEIPGESKNNPLIILFHSFTSYKGKTDEIPWCASWVGGCLIWSGFPSTNSAGAKSYVKYGQEVTEEWVEEGDEIYIEHPGGHVTFANKRFNRRTEKHFEGHGGNQGNKACVAVYETAHIRAVRRAIPHNKAPIPIKSKSGWAFDSIATNAILEFAPDLLMAEPLDIGKYCENWNTIDRTYFYNCLLAALCKFESNYNPTVEYKEGFSDSSGNPVISRGLLQISIESARSYVKDRFKITENDLHDPAINIKIGVLIMRRWILNDDRIQGGGPGSWLGMARYWSPFRKQERILAIQNRVKEATRV